MRDTRHASVVLRYNFVCVDSKLVHTSLFGRQLRMTIKLTYLMTEYYTPIRRFSMVAIYNFIRIKLASDYTLQRLFI